MTRSERIAASFAAEGLACDALAVAKVLSYAEDRHFGTVDRTLGPGDLEDLCNILKVCSSTLFAAVKDFQEEIGDPTWDADSYHGEQERIVREADELYEQAKSMIEALPEERHKPNLDLLRATADLEDKDAIPVIRRIVEGLAE